MPSLENIVGSSLVPDLQGAFDRGGRAFLAGEALDERTLAKEQAVTKKIDTQNLLTKLEQPGLTIPQRTQILSQMASVDEKLASRVSDVIEKGDDAQQKELELVAKDNFKALDFMLTAPDGQLGALLSDEINRRLADSTTPNPDELIRISAMREGDRRVALMQKRFMADSTGKLAEESKNERARRRVEAGKGEFEDVKDSAGNITGQRNVTTNELTPFKDGKVPSASTKIGKAGEDFKNGFINQKQLDSIVKGELADGTGDDKQATGESKIFANGSILNALKDGTSEFIDPEGNKLTGQARINGQKVAMQAEFDRAGLISGNKKAASAAIDQSIKAFEGVAAIRSKLLLMDSAVAALDAGAKTGPIISKLPSFRASSLRLDQIQAELGLNVIQSTTFGSLSEAELAFALSTALPKSLEREPLRDWIIRKKEAQEKLSDYLSESASFLGTPGNTVKDWIDAQKELQTIRESDKSRRQNESGVGAGSFTFNPSTGKLERSQ